MGRAAAGISVCCQDRCDTAPDLQLFTTTSCVQGDCSPVWGLVSRALGDKRVRWFVVTRTEMHLRLALLTPAAVHVRMCQQRST